MIHYNISLTGKMRSGKDTVQEMLIKSIIYQITSKHSKHLSYPLVAKLAFGDAVKKYSRELFPGAYENNNVKQRKLLQSFGQKMREIDEDVWIKILDKELQRTVNTPSVFEDVFFKSNLEKVIITFITDVRQPNEFEYAKDLGIVIKVEADDKVRKERMSIKGEDVSDELVNHETESHIDSYETDFTVDNNGDTVELRRQLEPIIQYILEDITSKIN